MMYSIEVDKDTFDTLNNAQNICKYNFKRHGLTANCIVIGMLNNPRCELARKMCSKNLELFDVINWYRYCDIDTEYNDNSRNVVNVQCKNGNANLKKVIFCRSKCYSMITLLKRYAKAENKGRNEIITFKILEKYLIQMKEENYQFIKNKIDSIKE